MKPKHVVLLVTLAALLVALTLGRHFYGDTALEKVCRDGHPDVCQIARTLHQTSKL